MRRTVFVALTTVLFGCNAILGIEEGTPEPDDASSSSTGSSGSTGASGASSGSGTSAASTGAGGSQSTGAAGATGSGVGGSTGAGGNTGAGGSTGASGSGGSAGAGGGPTGSGGAAGASGGGGKAGTAGTGGALRDAASDGALVDASKDTGSIADAAFDGNDGRCFVAIAYVVPGGAGARTGCSIADAAPSVAVALPSVNHQGTVRVAEGIYTGQSITIDRAVSVDGGWDVTFALHDAATHPTVLRGAPTILTVSGAAITSQTTISGLNIQADSAGRAVIVTASADPILVGNIIAGGNGGGGDSEAIYIDGGAAPILRANYLRGGVGTSYSIGVRVASSGGAVLIERNRIEAGYSPSNSVGLQLQGPAVMLANNLVFGGNAALQTRAIETAGNPTFVNNTLHGGTGDSSTGIYGQGSPIIVNNLILAPGASFGTCIGLVPNGPRTLFNNLLFTCTHALYDNNGANITSIATVNGLNGKEVPDGTCAPTVNCQHAKFAGNVTTAVPPASIFTNIAGADSVLATLGDNDWHLATTDPAITQGGHNAALADCGTTETPASCGGVTVDFAGAARSDPYSIGAYEK